MMNIDKTMAVTMERLMAENAITEHHWIDVAQIPIEPAVRKMCEQNSCGHYGRNHMCPPAVKDIGAWKVTIRSFTQALLVSKAYPIQDSFDLEAMTAAGADFEKTLRQIKAAFQGQWPEKATMLLGAGACRYCKTCACVDGEPCRFPEYAFSSVEACGVDVVALTRTVGATYYNGKDTVTYFGMVLFR